MHSRTAIGFGLCVLTLALAGPDWVALHGQGGEGAPKSRERRLVYAAVPGSLDRNYGGSGVVVFDANANWRFVKRMKTWEYPASKSPIMIRGINASVTTGLLYVTRDGSIGAWDLATEQKVWEESYDGDCCDRAAMSPDGKTLYIPAENVMAPAKQFKWHIVDAATGKLIKTVQTPASNHPHNTVAAPDGSRVFMAGYQGPNITVFDPKTMTVTGTVGPFSGNTRPFTTNGNGSLLFVKVNGPKNGFEIGDVKTGKMIHQVEVVGFPNCNCSHGLSGHGIAMTPDEKEIWIVDGNNLLHVFDSTVMPPKQKASITLRGAPHWVTIGLDAKYAYPASGDVVDIATKKVVGGMIDETGLPLRSEKLLELAFDANGKLIRAVDQFGVGQMRAGTN